MNRSGLANLVCCFHAVVVPAQVIAVKAGKLVDAEAATALKDQIILIRDRKIEAAGHSLPVPALIYPAEPAAFLS